MPDPNSGYTWDARSARYRDAAGHFVSSKTIRAAVNQAIDGAKAETDRHCAALAAGSIGTGEWQTRMADTLRSLHCCLAAAARGGWDAMTPADWGRVGAETKRQYQYLAGFAQDIAAGAIDPQSSAVAFRARLYTGAGRQTYYNQTRIAAGAAGLRWERNVLGAADHCVDCLAATAAGWVPVGTLSLPGQRRCRTECQCHLETK